MPFPFFWIDGMVVDGLQGLGHTKDSQVSLVPGFGARGAKACLLAAGFHHSLVITLEEFVTGKTGTCCKHRFHTQLLFCMLHKVSLEDLGCER